MSLLLIVHTFKYDTNKIGALCTKPKGKTVSPAKYHHHKASKNILNDCIFQGE